MTLMGPEFKKEAEASTIDSPAKRKMTAYCAYCKEESALYFRTRDLNRGLSEEAFDYFRCPACELIFLSPIPANLGHYYPQSYYTLPQSVADLAAAARPEQYKVEIVRRFMPGGRLLEIGPGSGGFACLAKQAGYEVEAIEMDARVCRYLTDVIGVRAINSADVCAALKTTEPYHAITMWHNIEHLPNPLEAFAAAVDRLLPGGILVIAAPNPAAFQFKMLGRFWTHVDAPRHLYLIPLQLLTRRATELGLKTVWTTTDDSGGRGWNTFGWQESLYNLAPKIRGRRFVRKIGSAIVSLLGPIERRELKGSAYTIVFQKGREV